MPFSLRRSLSSRRVRDDACGGGEGEDDDEDDDDDPEEDEDDDDDDGVPEKFGLGSIVY